MKNLSLNAKVICQDGLAGKSTHLVVNPATGQITYVVVQREDDHEYVVPVDKVTDTGVKRIVLNCSIEELKQFTPYEEVHYVHNDSKTYENADLVLPYSVPMATDFIELDESNIPADQVAINRGTGVEATDGWVGNVDEFIVSPKSGKITHLVLREGHFWGKKTITLPLTTVDRVFDDTVYLKIDKATLKELPTVPVRRTWGFSDAEIELVVLAFDTAGKAEEVLDFLQSLKREKIVARIRNAAILVKDANGKVSIKEAEDVDKRHGAIFGAITGGLVGLVGGPVGAIVGAAAGAATGRIAADKIDMGFSDNYLESLQKSLQPNSSAIIALVEHEWASTVTEALAKQGGQVFRQALPDAIINRTRGEESSDETEEE
jgi:uncharacterized membrane protein/sporulation protein YlmC with PRC-barrel domain